MSAFTTELLHKFRAIAERDQLARNTVLRLIERAHEANTAEAAVARVREYHAKVEWRPGTPRPSHAERGVCEECWVSFPCLTILALDRDS